jgi:molybdopterin-guanine dinucleotide biosynthesis protein A
MTGIVLCGGSSSRMGTDKGLLKLQAKTWAQTALDKLTAFQIPVVLSVNEQQYPAYAEVFSPEILMTDSRLLTIKGPLLGVLSAHVQYPQEDLLILACDMPLMQTNVIKELLTTASKHPIHDAVLFSNDGGAEPLCAIYRHTALALIWQMAIQDRLQKHSMKYMLDQINPFFIPLSSDNQISFRNFNAHAELNGG